VGGGTAVRIGWLRYGECRWMCVKFWAEVREIYAWDGVL